VRKLFITHPNGGLINNSKEFLFLEPFAALGVQNIYVLPIYNKGNLCSLLYIGLGQNQTLTSFEETCARNLANRLGVAKTATVLKNELYIREYFDPVTNLYNRQACRDRLSQEISRARRQKAKLATFYIQLDGLKKINDSAGSVMMDEVLKEIGELLATNMREADIIARFSDNEFVIIISDIKKIEHANRVADKIFGLLAKPIEVAESEFHVLSYTGISIYPDDGMSVDEIINHANHAMFSAKKNNASHYAFYEENMSAKQIQKIALERGVRAALLKDELYMVYQPQVNVRNGNVIGVEALMRWDHPDHGTISPIEFIKVAEETGLIVQLGQYGRKQAFEQYAKWASKGIAPLSMALNVSSYEIQRKEFVPELIKLLKDTEVPPHAIELEVTESLLIDSSGNVSENIQSLHNLGIRIAIDDFGTGYSNLSYLVRFPFDVLKIDKSFMQDIGDHSGSTQIVAMIIDMAHHLGKTVCAEGVENETQRRFLVNSGCDSIQGYLVSKPLEVEKFEHFMIQNSATSLSKAVEIAMHSYN
jgi:diguanylate cyclase (GGDEF)-like protein